MRSDPLSVTFAALADPTRRAILARLAEGEATVNELAAPHAMSLPSVSRHLKVLERAGLVVKSRSAQWRPCRLDPAPLAVADEWMAPYREFFEARLGRLEQQLARTTTRQEDR
jgi:DNA-binding transcriptional ArsR family regulator